jgi:hypothetical protein
MYTLTRICEHKIFKTKGTIMNETVTISKLEFLKLSRDSLLLTILGELGVDNWEGYSMVSDHESYDDLEELRSEVRSIIYEPKGNS